MAEKGGANGANIGNTPFTIDWLVDLLKKSSPQHDHDSVKLKEFTFEDITGGIGFLSTILRIKFTWNKSTSDLPNSIILKIPGMTNADGHFARLPWTAEESAMMAKAKEAETMEEQLGFAIVMHKNEMTFYEFFGGDKTVVPMPKYYFGREYDPVNESEGIIVMEDLSHGTAMAQLADGLNIKQVEAIVEQLAVLHVQSLASSDWLDKFPENEAMAKKGPPIMMAVASMLTRVKPEWFSGLFEKVAPMYTREKLAEIQSSFEAIGMSPVLVHGDLWTSNMLWAANEKNEASDNLIAIIDWQMAHPGNCCEDIARVLLSSVDGQLRREHTEHILRVYHMKLTNLSQGAPPFTFEQVQLAYKAILPYALLILLFGTPMYINIDAIVDGPTKLERQEQLLLRARLALEDVIELLGL
uniref:CHK kinase-like domain-containing protein n=1 Tax=Plectus sambesii TaxID=2011161 RepID=A0A914UKP3_9BILA